ncbi:MAG: TetR/AcrR family transcriptional regulator [Candidatus Pristimantibacillus lignocellulolyticus]|uniref:TetR/AcrR family transcriptional regulator n=1 Tax=Candidatus Pristimantibacillus lignocellulolyticus TaxID=2994561 RepID=A0A9J6ZCW1_9BACL|nr:MAG: TetR/AcrR family transcriptional regulator [Candidatus Pristimantibacillus lignocellulolyticus]
MNKKQQQSNQTKKRILDASKELFTKKGYAATSIEEISDITGFSKGNIYYHFKSKEGLFLDMLDEWEVDWADKWEIKKQKYTTSIEKLYGLAEHLVEDDFNHPLTNVADEFYTTEKSNSEVHERLQKSFNERIQFCQQLLLDGMNSDEFKQHDSLIMAKILDGMVIGLSSTCRDLELKETLRLYKQAIDVFLYGIAQK